MNNSSDELNKELAAHGAREYEVIALGMNPDRGLAALKLAVERGVDRPVPYAIHLFDAADWNPSGEVTRRGTNLFADKKCEHCDGHGMVLVTDDPHQPYGETWAPCAACNGECDTAFYRTDGTRLKALPR